MRSIESHGILLPRFSRISFVGKITGTGIWIFVMVKFLFAFWIFPYILLQRGAAAGFTFRRGIFFFLPPFFFFFPSLSLSSPSFSPSGKKSNPGAMFNRDSSGQISFPVFDGRLTDERALSISRHGFWTWNNLMKRKPLASPTMALCFGEEKKKREKFYGIGIHKGEHVFINR